MARQDQILRFLVEAEGADALKPFLQSVKDLEGASEETRQAADALLQELEDAASLTKVISEFQRLEERLAKTSTAYEAARTKVDVLAKALQSTNEPSRRQQEEFDRAQAALARLGTEYAVQQAKLGQYASRLTEAGVSTKDFAAAQQQITQRAGAASAGLQQLATAARSTQGEQAALAERLRDGDEAFRRQVEASRSAREALERLKQGTKDAADAQQDAAGKAGFLSAAWGKLAAAGAALAGYLTFRNAIEGVKNILGLGDAAERTRLRFEALYGSQDAGAQAFTQLRELSNRLGQDFAATAEAAAKLKSFGLDPLDGSLEALINQNARLGGSQQTLEGLILAVGQAWAKQKLQGEEILQLVERGVPVWDLLAQATGKNTLELQKLSEAGKLGRAEIAALVQEIGQSTEGAATANLSTFGGLIQQIRARWNEFLTTVADSGVLDYAKEQLQALLAEVQRLAANGTLREWAQSVSNAIVGLGQALTATVKTVYEYSAGLLALAKAFAAIKVATLAADVGMFVAKLVAGRAGIAAFTASAAGAATSVGGLGAAMARLPTLLRLSIIAVGVEVALESLVKLHGAYKDLEAAQMALNKARTAERDQNEALRGQIDGIKSLYEAYGSTAIRTVEEINRLTAAGAQQYEFQLQGAQRYYRALEVEARRANDAVALTEARRKLEEITGTLDQVRERVRDAATEAQTLTGNIGEFGRQMAAQFLTAQEAGTEAATALQGAFDRLDLTSSSGLNDALDAIDAIGGLSREAGDVLERELRAKLTKLSDEDFARVEAAAKSAFAEGSNQAERFAEAINGVNLQRLGLSLDQLSTGFTSAGRAAVNAFSGAIVEIERTELTAEQKSAGIAAAFDSAFSRVSKRPELEALRQQLVEAFQAGQINAEQFNERMAKIAKSLEQLEGAADKAGGKTTELSNTLREVSDTAGEAADEIGRGAAETENWGYAAAAAKVEFGDMSQELIDLALSMQSQARSSKEIIDAWDGVNRQYQDNIKRIDAREAAVERELDQLDDQRRALRALGDEYKGISDDRLSRLLQKEEELRRLRERAGLQTREMAAAERELRGELEASSTFTQNNPLTYQRSIRVDVFVRADASAGNQTLSDAMLQQIADKLQPQLTRAVLDEIARERRAAGG